jgi:PKD domain
MLVLAALTLAAWLSASGAALAVVTSVKVGLETTTVGMQPRSVRKPYPIPGTAASFANASGAPVMHSSAIYAIYWDPEYGYHGDWEHSINTFMQRLGTASGSLGTVNAVTEQYTDKSNSRAAFSTSFRGAYSDVKQFPFNGCTDPDVSIGFPDKEAQKDNVACLTDAQLRQELQTFIAAYHLPTGMGTIYYLLTPPGVTVCVDKGESTSAYCSDNAPATASAGHSFCSYHSFVNPNNAPEGDGSTVIYSVIPWTVGGLGDAHLADEAPGYECQDGGYDPTSEPIEQLEEKPHQQEPNQEAAHVGPDGAYDSGLADLIINQVNVEQRNTITNPLLDGWQDSAGNEVVDECRNFFASTLGGSSEVGAKSPTGAGNLYNQIFGEGRYYLNTTFNLAMLLQRYPGIPCLPGIDLKPQFTSPDPVNSGELVGFDARESDVTLDAGVAYASGSPFEVYPTYSWDFGDGTTYDPGYRPGAAPQDVPSVFHSYQYGGTYAVTLTVTDIGGNTTTTTNMITVDGPPPPPSTSGGSGSGTSGGAAPPPAPATSIAAPAPSLPGPATSAPRLLEKVVSYSLKKVLRYGLAVSYYANQQVAGGLEAMISSKLAKRLHLKGQVAKGLPKGYPKQVVLGGAVLVTTAPGHGMLRVKFPTLLAKRLASVHKLKLTLRIVVRNADRLHPKKTTLLSTVVLKG